jgi:hypothetical protein
MAGSLAQVGCSGDVESGELESRGKKAERSELCSGSGRTPMQFRVAANSCRPQILTSHDPLESTRYTPRAHVKSGRIATRWVKRGYRRKVAGEAARGC